MTRLLVSVRSAEEAQIALAGGADLIDVKEPRHGPLGAASAEVLSAVIHAVAGRAPVSAALGELLELKYPTSIGSRTLDALAAGATAPVFAKVGLAGCADLGDWEARWRTQVARITSYCQAVAVVYADHSAARSPAPLEILVRAADLGCSVVLVDTFTKSGGDLFSWWPKRQLLEFADRVREQSMAFVVAGSLTLETFPLALLARPDFVAVRGAACDGAREAAVALERVRALKQALRSTSRLIA